MFCNPSYYSNKFEKSIAVLYLWPYSLETLISLQSSLSFFYRCCCWMCLTSNWHCLVKQNLNTALRFRRPDVQANETQWAAKVFETFRSKINSKKICHFRSASRSAYYAKIIKTTNRLHSRWYWGSSHLHWATSLESACVRACK